MQGNVSKHVSRPYNVKASFSMLHFYSLSGFTSSSIQINDPTNMYSVTLEFDPACDLDPSRLCLSVCCRDDGDPGMAVDLPTSQAFYLLKVCDLLLKNSFPLDIKM